MSSLRQRGERHALGNTRVVSDNADFEGRMARVRKYITEEWGERAIVAVDKLTMGERIVLSPEITFDPDTRAALEGLGLQVNEANHSVTWYYQDARNARATAAVQRDVVLRRACMIGLAGCYVALAYYLPYKYIPLLDQRGS